MNKSDFQLSQEEIDSILAQAGLESLRDGQVEPLDDLVSER
ncbi:hypothetical protein OS242_20115 [Tumebacillus sp. DT12]|uniref:Uncharacterized protein n=1 Tax=Tumebacillus lacus TaxID=2995335 RepID=A0ABT3X8A4_9BACL|nr:hypothetical protein [Tumebacillus lacus]MCX7572217.1 hypothetical protein [Tumebacillus lacus]